MEKGKNASKQVALKALEHFDIFFTTTIKNIIFNL